jgi:hypothetical protein
VYATVNPPGSTSTQIRGINNAGQLSGFYEDAGGLTHGFLATPPAPNPDLNGNGFVDAADYVTWRKMNLSIDHYDLWRSNFGDEISSGAGATGVVPEPGVLVPFGIGVIFLASRRRDRRRQ